MFILIFKTPVVTFALVKLKLQNKLWNKLDKWLLPPGLCLWNVSDMISKMRGHTISRVNVKFLINPQ